MTTHLPRRRTSAALVAALLTLSACQSPTPADAPGDAGLAPSEASPTATDASATDDAAGPGTQVGIADPDAIDPARLAPLEGLGPCSDLPDPPPTEVDLTVLPLPAESVVTTADDDGPLISAQGISPRTPVEIMVEYLRLEGWTVLSAEDEVFESETLLERGDLRVFVKSQGICERASAWVMFASSDPDLVPAPTGAP